MNAVLIALTQLGITVSYKERIPSINEIFLKPPQIHKMKKFLLILKREYFAKIRNKSFVVMTFKSFIIGRIDFIGGVFDYAK